VWIATDDTSKYFFQDLMETRSLASLYDFENREGIFLGVHRSYKFCLLTLTGAQRPAVHGAEFVFFAHSVDDLHDEQRRFTLAAEDLALLNPNTRTCPVFRSKRAAALTKAIYRRVPVLINVFRRGNDVYLPLYKAKLFHHFDHRWATHEGLDTRDLTSTEKANPEAFALPRYWVLADEVTARLADKWRHGWLLAPSTPANRTRVASIRRLDRQRTAYPRGGLALHARATGRPIFMRLDPSNRAACCDMVSRGYSACKRRPWSTRQNVGTSTIGMPWLSPTLSKSSSALTT
jgi:hypothetical protein